MNIPSKIYISTTSKAPSYILLNDVTNIQTIQTPIYNLDLTRYNTVNDLLNSAVLSNAIKNDYIIAYDEEGELIDYLTNTQFVDINITSISDGDSLVYNSSTKKFENQPLTGGSSSVSIEKKLIVTSAFASQEIINLNTGLGSITGTSNIIDKDNNATTIDIGMFSNYTSNKILIYRNGILQEKETDLKYVTNFSIYFESALQVNEKIIFHIVP